MKTENLLITGIHRSGTTLACWLINQASNAVALIEPMNVSHFIGKDVKVNVVQINQFFQTERISILETGMATMNQLNQEIKVNSFEDTISENGLRPSLVTLGKVQIKQKLSPDFLLAIKHNAAYCALLPSLTREFFCLGIVRNPLAILLSWN